MTNKEYIKVKLIAAAIVLFLIGMSAGAVIVSSRYDSEIRADQLELEEQVVEILTDKAKIDDLIQRLIIHIEQLKLERQELRKLQLKLSKGEKIK